jgi:hypothetical protein
MTTRALLVLPRSVHDQLSAHLLPRPRAPEEAAFAFAMREANHGDDQYRYVEWFPVPPEGFASRSPVHFELTDEIRARAIKRAHVLGATLVEFHSHTGPWPAAFSASDIIGFREFVPHVWWRLKGRPYVAVVVAPSGFDTALWVTGPETPSALDGSTVEWEMLRPTGLTDWNIDDD